jgi:hypothetical protein
VSDKCGKQGNDANCFCFALRDNGNVDRVLRVRFNSGQSANEPTFARVAQEVSRPQ